MSDVGSSPESHPEPAVESLEDIFGTSLVRSTKHMERDVLLDGVRSLFELREHLLDANDGLLYSERIDGSTTHRTLITTAEELVGPDAFVVSINTERDPMHTEQSKGFVKVLEMIDVSVHLLKPWTDYGEDVKRKVSFTEGFRIGDYATQLVRSEDTAYLYGQLGKASLEPHPAKGYMHIEDDAYFLNLAFWALWECTEAWINDDVTRLSRVPG